MTLEELAKRVGTTAQTIQRLETDNMTVSVDWLTRIANAFGLSAAELLRDRPSHIVEMLGDLGADGLVARAEAAPTGHFAISAPSDKAVAVRIRERFGPYEAGTVLIANRHPTTDTSDIDGRDCLIQLCDGTLLFRRLINSTNGPTAFVPYQDGAPVERGLDIEWIALVVMSVRYIEPA